MNMNMNAAIASVLATASVAFIGFLAYRMRCRSNDSPCSASSHDSSCLEDDFRDILAFVPMDEVREVVERYMKYDPQIGDTISFLTDQKRFVLRELQNMPQLNTLLVLLHENGMDLDAWHDRIRCFWKTSPRFMRSDPSAANGGLTGMINNILKCVPLDELHEFLRQKAKYSSSFRKFLRMLKSPDFKEFCDAVEDNAVIHHHFFWAKESGLEVTFASELFNELHGYLTETLLLHA